MTAQFFPDVDQILAILMAELPQGVYATDLANNPNPNLNSSSSAEARSAAQLYANIYENLFLVYQDKFISTVTQAGLSQWEIELFNTPQDPTLTYAQRQANLLTAIRYQGGINYQTIYNLVQGILAPTGLTFQILQWNGCGAGPVGAWILEVSTLDFNTYLAGADPLLGAGRGVGITPLDCNLNYAAAGLTLAQLQSIQQTAYTYEVQIFGNADSATLAKLNSVLTAKEPARSTHVITNNAPEPGWISPTSLDGGSFTGDVIDDSDGGSFTRPPGPDRYDGGSF